MEFAPETAYDANKLKLALESIPVMEAFVKNVREFAYNEALHGRGAAGYKLVEKLARRKWKDKGAVVKYLTMTTDLEPAQIYEEPSIRSPAQMEKLVPKKQLEKLTVRESSGYALVPESDERLAIKFDPKSEFTDIEA